MTVYSDAAMSGRLAPLVPYQVTIDRLVAGARPCARGDAPDPPPGAAAAIPGMTMRRATGFTLVELLVAMALLALLSALLVGGLHVSSTAVRRNEAASETLLRAEQAYNLMRRQFERAVPLALVS